MKLQYKLLLLLFGYVTTSSAYELTQKRGQQQSYPQQYTPEQQQQLLLQQIRQKEYQQKYVEEMYPQSDRYVSIIQNPKTKYVYPNSNPGFSERFSDAAPVTVATRPTNIRNQLQQTPAHQLTYTEQPLFQNRGGYDQPTVNINLNSHEKFNTQLFRNIAPNNIYTNMVYSPISLQTLMALVSLGAKDQTANELYRGLQLPNNRNSIATLFENLLKADKHYGSSHLMMANKIYHNDRISIKDYYYNIAQSSFNSEIQNMNFQDPVSASLIINEWVNGKTNGRIQNVITPQGLDSRTQVLLVNAIYFKAEWAKEFSVGDTLIDDFFVTPDEKLSISMMYTDDKFRYGYIENLKASIVELPYKNSDLSMMIILPDEINGLARLERSLNNIDLSTLSAGLSEEQVVLRLPKFRIQFEIDMVEPLKNLNIRTIFSSNSDLSDMFVNNSNQPVGISKIQHRAYIDVNEAGSEAAAASFANVIPLSLTKTVTMSVNHPFIFAIRSPKAVYFIGHVVNPSV